MIDFSSIRRILKQLTEWLSRNLSAVDSAAVPNTGATEKYFPALGVCCLLIFVTALGVRFFQWQDNPATIGESLGSLINRYQSQAQGILEDGRILIPDSQAEPVGIQRLVHPPGYPILIAAVYKIFGHSNAALTWAHLLLNALSVTILFLLVAELLPRPLALIAGMLVAISPQLAAHSPVLLPDSLVALPILASVYLLVRARRKPSLLAVLLAGALIGFSCWLRSNAMLLAPFLSLLIFFTFAGNRRWRYALGFVVAAVLAISPVTIRNWVLFDRFIPLSLGAGITLVEGIADYDYDKRFAMPASDEEGKRKDAEWHNRPDYAAALWRPDGIERDRYRFSRGLAVIRDNPLWFLSVMMRRATTMLRYNDNLQRGWPADTCNAPLVSGTVPFGEAQEPPGDREPVWSTTAKELLANGEILAPDASIALTAGEQTLEISGDSSLYGEQFASAIIPVHHNTNYLLKLRTRLKRAPVAILVTSADRRISLGRLLGEGQARNANKTDAEQNQALSPTANQRDAVEESVVVGEIPFTSGGRSEVRLLVINNGGAQPAVGLGEVELVEIGKTPFLWTRPLRVVIRLLQKGIFRTAFMIPLILTGILSLWLAGRRRESMFLLAVPLYYLCVQSVFHTEYRYILPIHYFLIALAATTMYLGGLTGIAMMRRAKARL
jgi:hypothetical protein